MCAAPLLADLHRSGFPMGGEPSVAVDFVDTVYRDTPTSVVDLLADPQTPWWQLQSSRLVSGARPDHAATVRLREALRVAFEMTISGDVPDDHTLDVLNHFAGLVPTSPRLRTVEGTLTADTQWHAPGGADANLCAIARDGMTLLLDPDRIRRLRSCANPSCMMIFVAENAKRIWCSASGCGNRARAARHYYRQRAAGSSVRANHDREEPVS